MRLVETLDRLQVQSVPAEALRAEFTTVCDQARDHVAMHVTGGA